MPINLQFQLLLIFHSIDDALVEEDDLKAGDDVVSAIIDFFWLFLVLTPFHKVRRLIFYKVKRYEL